MYIKCDAATFKQAMRYYDPMSIFFTDEALSALYDYLLRLERNFTDEFEVNPHDVILSYRQIKKYCPACDLFCTHVQVRIISYLSDSVLISNRIYLENNKYIYLLEPPYPVSNEAWQWEAKAKDLDERQWIVRWTWDDEAQEMDCKCVREE